MTEIKVTVEAKELADAIATLAAVMASRTAYLEKRAAKEIPAEAKKPAKSEPVADVETPAEPEPEPTPEPEYTLEQVRAKLAALSQDGKQAQVKKIITEAGAKKLTEIPPEKYAEVMAKAGAI